MGLHQLNRSQFLAVQQLFDAESHLAVASALSGETPAEVYVDDLVAPREALLIVLNHRIFVAGTPRDDAFAEGIAALLRERYTSMATRGRPVERSIVFANRAWEDVLPALLAPGADVAGERLERLSFRLRLDATGAPDRSVVVPEGFELRQIDAALVADSTLGNHQALIDEIRSEAASVEDFSRSRFGYCLSFGHALVAWCLSEYNHSGRCEVGIETLPSFRRRGLALVTAGATLAHAKSHGISLVGWHCWKRNIASSSLARRLGFELVEEYPVWFGRFTRPAPTWDVAYH